MKLPQGNFTANMKVVKRIQKNNRGSQLDVVRLSRRIHKKKEIEDKK